ncbi:MAG: TolC family protein [Edaphocola sp.]
MNRSRLLNLIAGMVLYGLPMQAQDTSPATVWTLEDCLLYADANSYNINTARLAAATNRESLAQSKSALLPSVSGNATMTFSHTGTEFNDDSRINTNGNAGVSASMVLYNGGTLRNNINLNQISVLSSELQIEQSANNIKLQITQAYLNVLLDKENVRYNEDLVKTSQAQLEQMRQKYQVGSVARKAVVQLEAQLAQDKYNLATYKSSERLDKVSLKQLLLLPADTAFEIQAPDTVFGPQVLPPLSEVQKSAISFLPDVRIGELAIEASRYSLANAKAGYLPTLSASLGAGSSLGNTTNYSLGYSISNTFYQQAGLTLSVPIFSRRINKTNVEKAKINIKQAELDLANTKIGLSQTVERAYVNALNSQNQYLSAQEQLAYNEEALRISSEELRIGSANMVDYVQQRNLYVQALQQYIQAKYNAAMYLKLYEFYKGTPITLK